MMFIGPVQMVFLDYLLSTHTLELKPFSKWLTIHTTIEHVNNTRKKFCSWQAGVWYFHCNDSYVEVVFRIFLARPLFNASSRSTQSFTITRGLHLGFINSLRILMSGWLGHISHCVGFCDWKMHYGQLSTFPSSLRFDSSRKRYQFCRVKTSGIICFPCVVPCMLPCVFWG